MTKDRIHVSEGLEISFNKKHEIINIVDKMRKTETIEGVSRASMIRIAILEAWNKRNITEASLK